MLRTHSRQLVGPLLAIALSALSGCGGDSKDDGVRRGSAGNGGAGSMDGGSSGAEVDESSEADASAGVTGQDTTSSTDGNSQMTAPAGSTGGNAATGSTGASGGTGQAGPTGASGPSGATGSTGAFGSTAAFGPTGMSGPRGASGSTGRFGSTGASGSSGPRGSSGASGGTGAIPGFGATAGFGGTGAQCQLTAEENDTACWGSYQCRTLVDSEHVAEVNCETSEGTDELSCNCVDANGTLSFTTQSADGAASTQTCLGLILDCSTPSVSISGDVQCTDQPVEVSDGSCSISKQCRQGGTLNSHSIFGVDVSGAYCTQMADGWSCTCAGADGSNDELDPLQADAADAACEQAFAQCSNLDPVDGMVTLFHDAMARGVLDN